MRCKACNKFHNPNPKFDRFNKPYFPELCSYCQSMSTRSLGSDDLSDVYGLDLEYRSLIHTIEQEEKFNNE